MGGFKQRVRSRPSHLILRDARCDKCVMQRRKKGRVIGGGMGGGGVESAGDESTAEN